MGETSEKDQAALLQKFRRLLRQTECEAVMDTSDQNLFDILIRSEERKIALLTWFIQHLYSPEVWEQSSFEDLLGIFLHINELKSFLKGYMPVTEQFEVWKLMLSTLSYKKMNRSVNERETVLNKMLRGDLVNDIEAARDSKIDSSCYAALVSNKKLSSQFQAQVKETEEKLKLNYISDINLDYFKNMVNCNKDNTTIQKLVDVNELLNKKINVFVNNQSNSEIRNSYELTEDQLNRQLLKSVKTNLNELEEVMNSNIRKDFEK